MARNIRHVLRIAPSNRFHRSIKVINLRLCANGRTTIKDLFLIHHPKMPDNISRFRFLQTGVLSWLKANFFITFITKNDACNYFFHRPI